MSGALREDVVPWPAVLLGASVAAMWAGLCIDARNVDAEALIGLCGGAGAWWSRLWIDWRFMPVSHGLMLSVAMAATIAGACRRIDPPRSSLTRLCQGSLCLGAMLAGMGLCGPVATPLCATFGLPAFVSLALSQAGGMLFGMLALASLPIVLNNAGRLGARLVRR